MCQTHLVRRHAPAMLLSVATFLIAMLSPELARAQSATVRGFVTDLSDGRPLVGATVALFEIDDEGTAGLPRYGTVTNADGLYIVTRIAPDRYLLRVSFVGYETHRDTLTLAAGDVRSMNVALADDTEALDEVLIETERTAGMARVTAGLQTIRPEEIRLVPSPDVSGDLVSYLTTLPGVVATGDQGGQFFVRGGEPTQNLVLLDGMIVYQPFHLLGFYSVFPTDVLSRVDFYAGGFPSRYGTRLASVIDVATRSGNNRRVEGMASISPFTGALRLEGPLIPGRFSFLVSGRESFIEQGAARYVREDLPFRFGDAFAKVDGPLTAGSRLSLTALRTHDRGTVGRELGGQTPEDVTWRNEGVGMRLLMLPRVLPLIADLHLSHSRMASHLGPSGDPTRSSTISNTRIALDATFVGERADVRAGWEVVFTRLTSELGGLYQNVASQDTKTPPGAMYVEPDLRVTDGLRIQPGLRAQFYNVRIEPYLEPRVRLTWERGIHQISAAAGLYHQELVGITDRRDAASVYTVWTTIPRRGSLRVEGLRPVEELLASGTTGLLAPVEDVRAGRIGQALHLIAGYRISPMRWLELSVEGFYKEMTNLFVAEWTALPQMTTRLQPATGRAGGFEARAEVRRSAFYAYVNYGLSSTLYSANAPSIAVWFGTDRVRFTPAHDRRHQVNALVNVSSAGFSFSTRWEVGTGFPFTRPRSFDGFVLLEDVESGFDRPLSRRVIYERPYSARLPAYHRLDVSLERTFRLPQGALTLHASALNLYDRRNLFYYDTFTLERVDQLPVIPSLGFRLEFE